MIAMVWLFMTSMVLMTLGLSRTQKGDIWECIIAWGFGTLMVAVIAAINKAFPNWWK